jgi:hypothetical protein
MAASEFPDPRRTHPRPSSRRGWEDPLPNHPVETPEPDLAGPVPTSHDDVNDARRDMELREQAVERTRFMSLQLAQHAWDLRFSDPLAPHALALMYAHPARHAGWYDLKAATRIWLEGDAPRSPADLVFGFTQSVLPRATDPLFDPRTELANRMDDGMAPDAWFVGTGLVGLDTDKGSWEQARSMARTHLDIPATIRIVMIDETWITCERRASQDFNALVLRTTKPLAISALDRKYPYSQHQPYEMASDPYHSTLLQLLRELTHMLWQQDNARLAARG